MLVLGGAVLGMLMGAITARRKGGSRLDMVQYAASGGIALALVGMIATIIIHRIAV